MGGAGDTPWAPRLFEKIFFLGLNLVRAQFEKIIFLTLITVCCLENNYFCCVLNQDNYVINKLSDIF